MVRNSAHDSICACSVDDVVDAVLHRYAEARTIGDRPGRSRRGVVRPLPGRAGHLRAQPRPAAALGTGRARGRRGRNRPPATCRSSPNEPGCPGPWCSTPPRCARCWGCCRDPKSTTTPGSTTSGSKRTMKASHITVDVGADERPNVPIAEAKQDIYARLGAKPDAVVHISLNQPPIRRIVARVPAVPGYGWQPFAPAPLAHPVEAQRARRHRRPLQRPGHGRGRRRPRHVLAQRTAGLRPVGGRWRPRGLVQLLTAAARHAGRHAGLGLGPAGRTRPGAGPCHHHRRLRVARSRRRVVTGTGRRALGGGGDACSSCGPTTRCCGWRRRS